jgi:signal peptidase I
MSPSSSKGDSPAVVAGGPRPGAPDDSGRPVRDEAAGRGATRLPQELDYRLRGLGTLEPDHVPVTPTRTDHRQHRRGPFLAKAIAFLAVAALAVPLLQHFVIQPFAMPGNAMSPSLQAGDRILVLKSSLLEGPLRSGEIVVFRPRQSLPCSVVGGRSGDLVLRIVALPGDTIRSAGETILVDGRTLSERGWYDPHFGQVGSTPIRSTTLAPGEYFVLDDNRSDACDSRAFGPISQSSVVGEAIAIIGRHGHVYFGAP